MLKKIPVSVWRFVSASILLLAAVLTFPGSFGITRTEQIMSMEKRDGFLLTAELPQGIKHQRGREFLFPDYPVVFEDGKALGRPRASAKGIANAGRGRYELSGSRIRFSTSDGGAVAGRVYTVCSPIWSLREPLLLGVWFLALLACAATLRLAMPGGEARLIRSPRIAFALLTFFLTLVAGFFCFKSVISDQMFLGIFVPAIWSALMGVSALQKHVAGRVGLIILALLPAGAGYFYYGFNAASHGSFLVGGIIPRSDAMVHFLQAAEIAVQGTTQVLFNGRFLYPAFYAVMLDISRLNVLVANLLVSSMVMLGLAFTCPLVVRRIGVAGTAIYCLLFWLYFRAHGCGLLMTENLGLLLGVLGFGFLLFSVDRDKIRPVFAAILFIGLGSAARPGALFVLPALALYAGIRVWLARSGRTRLLAASGGLVLGLLLIAGCFSANQIVMKSLSRGEGKTFGNFAFTLHGLLNETKWSTSAEQFGWDAALVMEHNVRQIKTSPGCLARGIGRAYGEMFKKGFLFRFGEERRVASAGMVMFLLASLACWLWGPLRADALWILLAGAGIVMSVPFAPPWDAGERPYAATLPVQVFLAAAGAAMALDFVRKLAERQDPVERNGSFLKRQDMGRTPMLRLVAASAFSRWVAFWSAFKKAPDESSGKLGVSGGTSLIALAVLCFILVLPAPLILKLTGYRHPLPAGKEVFLPGSLLVVTEEGNVHSGIVSRGQFLDRLSDLQAVYPDEGKNYISGPGDFLLAINWSNLETFVRPLSGNPGGNPADPQ
ncbi:MAG: hypothetical protein WCS31_01475 [Verrucomicrobiae bacterium]